MSRFNQFSQSTSSASTGKNDRHDELSSQSGSEDGSSYAIYSEAQKNETDPEGARPLFSFNFTLTLAP